MFFFIDAENNLKKQVKGLDFEVGAGFIPARGPIALSSTGSGGYKTLPYEKSGLPTSNV
jgi:hypothetical protein